jgi:hypothetical protein
MWTNFGAAIGIGLLILVAFGVIHDKPAPMSLTSQEAKP